MSNQWPMGSEPQPPGSAGAAPTVGMPPGQPQPMPPAPPAPTPPPPSGMMAGPPGQQQYPRPGMVGGPPTRPKAPPREPTPLTARIIVPLIATAIATDIALFRHDATSVSAALLFAAIPIALLISGRLRDRTTRLVALAGVFFALMLAVRSNDALVAFNVISAAGLPWLAAARNGKSWTDIGPLKFLAATWSGIEHVVLAPGRMLSEVTARARSTEERPGSRQAAGVVRGLIIAVPVVLVLGALLASADAVFASFLSVDLDPSSGISHLVLLTIGLVGGLALLSLAGADREESTVSGPRLGATETLTVLGCVAALFAVFALAQVVALSGAGDRILDDADVTFKEYARSGFFQLLWVAGLTVPLVAALRSMVIADSDRAKAAIRTLGVVTVALTLLIVVVAAWRLALYIGDDGLTPLRFYSMTFSFWVGAVCLLLIARTLNWHPDRAWLLPASAVLALGFLAVLSLVNPEGIIARENLNRDDSAIIAHANEPQFGDDAVPTLESGLSGLDARERTAVEWAICGNGDRYASESGLFPDSGASARRHDGSWLDWNWSESRADDARERIC